jgi:hypothetical protein
MEPIAVTIVILAVGIIGYYLIGGATMVDPAKRPPAPNEAIDRIALAINRQENSPPSWNNPGDLTESFGFSNAGPQNSAGVLKFSSEQDGWNALYAKLLRIQNGESVTYPLSSTIAQLGETWSGGDPAWAVNVSRILGLSPDNSVSDLFGV